MAKVLIFGKFDILHPGHIHLIKKATRHGKVVAVLESDRMIKNLKNYHPFYTEKIRQKNLEKFGLEVFIRNGESAKEIVDILKPDILCFGYDQEFVKAMFFGLGNFKIEDIAVYKKEIFKSTRLFSVLADQQAGIYLVDKDKGMHSFEIVSQFRKVLGIKKVGFSGTLDPLASGLMIVAVSKATRLLDWFHILPKVYQADILFGQTSDTYDLEGKVKIKHKAKEFSQVELEKLLKKFKGKQKQIVPIYSAKKIKGQKLHELARAGREVFLPSTDIEIYCLKIKSFNYPKLKLEISCSAGTYIRSLANDLGKAMKTGAVLTDLRRTSIGDFELGQALAIKNIDKTKIAKNKILAKDIIESLNQWFYQSPLW